MKKIAILADSGCQIEIKDSILGIYIVPLSVTVNNHSYLDQLEVRSEAVFKQMRDNGSDVKTSQPPLGELVKSLQQIKKDGYNHVICISIATGLSSTLSSMKTAGDMTDMPVTLIDSKATAHIQKELVFIAKKLIDEGYDEIYIENVLNTCVAYSRTIIMVPNLEHLKKGGRITPGVAMLAGLLKIVPVMELNHELGGKIDTLAKVRTQKKAMKLLVDRMLELGVNETDYSFAIEHVLCEEEALKVKDYLLSKLPQANITLRELPVVVGAHMGVGGIGVQYIKIKL